MRKKTPSTQWMHPVDLSASPERVLSHNLNEFLPEMRAFNSLSKLKKSPVYAKVRTELEQVLFGSEYGFYNDEPTTLIPKRFFRVVFWNLAGEVNFSSLLDIVRTHPVLRKADFYLFSNADIGMGRTQNRNIMRSLALELSHNYVFSTSYFYVSESGAPNQLGITGQALLTPYPIRSFYGVPLKPGTDPMRRPAKRIGSEKLLVCQIEMPMLKTLNLAVGQLDFSASPRQRAGLVRSMGKILNENHANDAVLFGGGLNTTTYISTHAVPQFFSFLNKIIREYDFICKDHHPHPEKFFEKKVFDAWKKLKFHFEDLNEMGKPTVQMPFEEIEVGGNWERKMSHAMVRGLKRFFYHGPNSLSLKLDWFLGNTKVRASNFPQSERPKVLSHLYHDKEPISTHYPIVLDFEVL